MKNLMSFGKAKAVIDYDPDIEMFRGEFINLNQGGADFYAKDVESLKTEGQTSLNEFIEMCKEDDIDPYKNYSGKFNVRIQPLKHQQAAAYAQSKGTSLNAIIDEALTQYLKH